MPLQVPPLTHAILKVRLLQILDAFSPHVNAISLKGKKHFAMKIIGGKRQILMDDLW